jgi:hypothetical protein
MKHCILEKDAAPGSLLLQASNSFKIVNLIDHKNILSYAY